MILLGLILATSIAQEPTKKYTSDEILTMLRVDSKEVVKAQAVPYNKCQSLASEEEVKECASSIKSIMHALCSYSNCK